MRTLAAALLAILLFGQLFAAPCPTGDVGGFYTTAKNGSDCVVTYQPGPQHSKDTWVYDQLPQSNFGASYYMNVETAQSEGGYGRYGFPLLEFDLSAIPKNSTIKSAELRLYKFSCQQEHTQCRENEVEAFRLNVPWEEGGCPSPGGCPGQASWDSSGPQQGSNWHGSLPEWTREVQPQDRVVSPVQNNVWVRFNLTRAAKGWVNGSFQNYGVVLQGIFDSNKDYQRHDYYTSDYQDPALRPMLVVIYNNTNASFEVTATGLPATVLENQGASVKITLNNTGDDGLDGGQLYIRRASDGTILYTKEVSLKKGESKSFDFGDFNFSSAGEQRYQVGAKFEGAQVQEEKEISILVLPAPKPENFGGPAFLALSVFAVFAAFIILVAAYISLGKGKTAQGKTKCPMCGYEGGEGRCPVCGTVY